MIKRFLPIATVFPFEIPVPSSAQRSTWSNVSEAGRVGTILSQPVASAISFAIAAGKTRRQAQVHGEIRFNALFGAVDGVYFDA